MEQPLIICKIHNKMKLKREGTFACDTSLNLFKYVVLHNGYSGFFYIAHARGNEEK